MERDTEKREFKRDPALSVSSPADRQDLVSVSYRHTAVSFFFMHLADAFIQSDLQLHSGYTFSLVCVFWESNPQPFALLTQCSTTEPHRNTWLHDLVIMN